MAVKSKRQGRTAKHYTLALNDGQELEVWAIRGGQTYGQEKELDNILTEFNLIQGRIDHLTKKAIQGESDKVYVKFRAELKEFKDRFQKLEPLINKALLTVLTDWKWYATEEDETSDVRIPLTAETIAAEEFEFKADVFSRLFSQFATEDTEKKDSFESTPDGTAQKESMELAPASTSSMSLQ